MSVNLNIIGLNIEEAKKKLTINNHTLRNVIVENNIIIKISSFG